jgi:hypothetical protein
MHYNIGDIIDSISDGSYRYMSHKGVLHLDDWRELDQARKDDDDYISSLAIPTEPEKHD